MVVSLGTGCWENAQAIKAGVNRPVVYFAPPKSGPAAQPWFIFASLLARSGRPHLPACGAVQSRKALKSCAVQSILYLGYAKCTMPSSCAHAKTGGKGSPASKIGRTSARISLRSCHHLCRQCFKLFKFTAPSCRARRRVWSYWRVNCLNSLTNGADLRDPFCKQASRKRADEALKPGSGKTGFPHRKACRRARFLCNQLCLKLNFGSSPARRRKSVCVASSRERPRAPQLNAAS